MDISSDTWAKAFAYPPRSSSYRVKSVPEAYGGDPGISFSYSRNDPYVQTPDGRWSTIQHLRTSAPFYLDEIDEPEYGDRNVMVAIQEEEYEISPQDLPVWSELSNTNKELGSTRSRMPFARQDVIMPPLERFADTDSSVSWRSLPLLPDEEDEIDAKERRDSGSSMGSLTTVKEESTFYTLTSISRVARPTFLQLTKSNGSTATSSRLLSASKSDSALNSALQTTHPTSAPPSLQEFPRKHSLFLHNKDHLLRTRSRTGEDLPSFDNNDNLEDIAMRFFKDKKLQGNHNDDRMTTSFPFLNKLFSKKNQSQPNLSSRAVPPMSESAKRTLDEQKTSTAFSALSGQRSDPSALTAEIARPLDGKKPGGQGEIDHDPDSIGSSRSFHLDEYAITDFDEAHGREGDADDASDGAAKYDDEKLSTAAAVPRLRSHSPLADLPESPSKYMQIEEKESSAEQKIERVLPSEKLNKIFTLLEDTRGSLKEKTDWLTAPRGRHHLKNMDRNTLTHTQMVCRHGEDDTCDSSLLHYTDCTLCDVVDKEERWFCRFCDLRTCMPCKDRVTEVIDKARRNDPTDVLINKILAGEQIRREAEARPGFSARFNQPRSKPVVTRSLAYDGPSHRVDSDDRQPEAPKPGIPIFGPNNYKDIGSPHSWNMIPRQHYDFKWNTGRRPFPQARNEPANGAANTPSQSMEDAFVKRPIAGQRGPATSENERSSKSKKGKETGAKSQDLEQVVEEE